MKNCAEIKRETLIDYLQLVYLELKEQLSKGSIKLSVKETTKNLYNELKQDNVFQTGSPEYTKLNNNILYVAGNTPRIIRIIETFMDINSAEELSIFDYIQDLNLEEFKKLTSISTNPINQIEELTKFLDENYTSTTTNSIDSTTKLIAESIENKDLEERIKLVESKINTETDKDVIDKLTDYLKVLNTRFEAYQQTEKDTEQIRILNEQLAEVTAKTTVLQDQIKKLNSQLLNLEQVDTTKTEVLEAKTEEVVAKQTEIEALTEQLKLIVANLELQAKDLELKELKLVGNEVLKEQYVLERAKLNLTITDLNERIISTEKEKSELEAKLVEATANSYQTVDRDNLQNNQNTQFADKPSFDFDLSGIRLEKIYTKDADGNNTTEETGFTIYTLEPEYDKALGRYVFQPEQKFGSVMYNMAKSGNNLYKLTLQLKSLIEHKKRIAKLRYNIETVKIWDLLKDNKVIVHSYVTNQLLNKANANYTKEQNKVKRGVLDKLFKYLKTTYNEFTGSKDFLPKDNEDFRNKGYLAATDFKGETYDGKQLKGNGRFQVRYNPQYEPSVLDQLNVDNNANDRHTELTTKDVFVIEYIEGEEADPNKSIIEIGRIRNKFEGVSDENPISKEAGVSKYPIEKYLMAGLKLGTPKVIPLPNITSIPIENLRPAKYNSKFLIKYTRPADSDNQELGEDKVTYKEWNEALRQKGEVVSKPYVFTVNSKNDIDLSNNYSINNGNSEKNGISGKVVSFISSTMNQVELEKLVNTFYNNLKAEKESEKSGEGIFKNYQKMFDEFMKLNNISFVVLNNLPLTLKDYAFNAEKLKVDSNKNLNDIVSNISTKTDEFKEILSTIYMKKYKDKDGNERENGYVLNGGLNEIQQAQMIGLNNALYSPHQTIRLEQTVNEIKYGLLDKIQHIFTNRGNQNILAFDEKENKYKLTKFALDTYEWLSNKISDDSTFGEHLEFIINDLYKETSTTELRQKFILDDKGNKVEAAADSNEKGIFRIGLNQKQYKDDIMLYAYALGLNDTWVNDTTNQIYFNPTVHKDNKTNIIGEMQPFVEELAKGRTSTSNFGMEMPSFVMNLSEVVLNAKAANDETTKKRNDDIKAEQEIAEKAKQEEIDALKQDTMETEQDFINRLVVELHQFFDSIGVVGDWIDSKNKWMLYKTNIVTPNRLDLIEPYLKEYREKTKDSKSANVILTEIEKKYNKYNITESKSTGDILNLRVTPENYQPYHTITQEETLKIYNDLFGSNYFVDFTNKRMLDAVKSDLNEDRITQQQYDEFIKEIETIGYNDWKKVLGYTFRDIIALNILPSGKIEKETVYHEAFHRVFKMINPLYKANILAEAKLKYGDLSDKQLEEKLADDYGKIYAKNNKPSVFSKDVSLLPKFIRQLFDKIKGLFTSFSSIENLFDNISVGYYKGFEVNEDFELNIDTNTNKRNRNVFLYNQLAKEVFGKKINGKLVPNNKTLEAVTKYLDGLIYDKLYTYDKEFKAEPLSFEKAFNQVRKEKLKEFEKLKSNVENLTTKEEYDEFMVNLELSGTLESYIETIENYNEEMKVVSWDVYYPNTTIYTEEDNQINYIIQKLFTPVTLTTTNEKDIEVTDTFTPFEVIVEQEYGLIKDKSTNGVNNSEEQATEYDSANTDFSFKDLFLAEKNADMSEELRHHLKNTDLYEFDKGQIVKVANTKIDISKAEVQLRKIFMKMKKESINANYNYTSIMKMLETEIENSTGINKSTLLSMYLKFFGSNTVNTKYKVAGVISFKGILDDIDGRGTKSKPHAKKYREVFQNALSLMFSYFDSVFTAKFLDSDITKGTTILDKTNAANAVNLITKGMTRSTIDTNLVAVVDEKGVYNPEHKKAFDKLSLQIAVNGTTVEITKADIKFNILTSESSLKNADHSTMSAIENVDITKYKEYLDTLRAVVNTVFTIDSTIHNDIIKGLGSEVAIVAKSNYVKELQQLAAGTIMVYLKNSSIETGLIIKEDISYQDKKIEIGGLILTADTVSRNYESLERFVSEIESFKSLDGNPDMMIKSAANENINTVKNSSSGNKLRRIYDLFRKKYQVKLDENSDAYKVDVTIGNITTRVFSQELFNIALDEANTNRLNLIEEYKTKIVGLKELISDVYKNEFLTGVLKIKDTYLLNALYDAENENSKNIIQANLRELTGIHFTNFLTTTTNYFTNTTKQTTVTSLIIPEITNSDKKTQYVQEIEGNFENLVFSTRDLLNEEEYVRLLNEEEIVKLENINAVKNDKLVKHEALMSNLNQFSNAAKSYFITTYLDELESLVNLLNKKKGVNAEYYKTKAVELKQIITDIKTDKDFDNKVVDNKDLDDSINYINRINNHFKSYDVALKNEVYTIVKSSNLRMAATGKEAKKFAGSTAMTKDGFFIVNPKFVTEMNNTTKKIVDALKEDLRIEAKALIEKTSQIELNQLDLIKKLIGSTNTSSDISSLREAYMDYKVKIGVNVKDGKETTKIYDEVTGLVHPLFEDFLLTYKINSHKLGILQNGMNFLYSDFVDLAKRSIGVSTAVESYDLNNKKGLPEETNTISYGDLKFENLVIEEQFVDILKALNQDAKGDAFDGGEFMTMIEFYMHNASLGDKYPDKSTIKRIMGTRGDITKNATALLTNQLLSLGSETLNTIVINALGGYNSPIYKEWIRIRNVDLKAKYDNINDYNNALNNDEDWQQLYEWFIDHRMAGTKLTDLGFNEIIKDNDKVRTTIADMHAGINTFESGRKIAPFAINNLNTVYEDGEYPTRGTIDNSLLGIVTNLNQQTSGSTIAAPTQENYITSLLGENFKSAESIYMLLGQLSETGLVKLEEELVQHKTSSKAKYNERLVKRLTELKVAKLNPQQQKDFNKANPIEDDMEYFLTRLQFILEQTNMQSNTYSFASNKVDANHQLLKASFEGAISSTIKKYTSKLKLDGRRDTVQSSTGIVKMYDLTETIEETNDKREVITKTVTKSYTKTQAAKKGLVKEIFVYRQYDETNNLIVDNFGKPLLRESEVFEETNLANFVKAYSKVSGDLTPRELKYESLINQETGEELRGDELELYIKAINSYELNLSLLIKNDHPLLLKGGKVAEKLRIAMKGGNNIKAQDYVKIVRDLYTFKDMEMLVHRDTFSSFELEANEDVNDVLEADGNYFENRMINFNNSIKFESSTSLRKLITKSTPSWKQKLIYDRIRKNNVLHIERQFDVNIVTQIVERGIVNKDDIGFLKEFFNGVKEPEYKKEKIEGIEKIKEYLNNLNQEQVSLQQLAMNNLFIFDLFKEMYNTDNNVFVSNKKLTKDIISYSLSLTQEKIEKDSLVYIYATSDKQLKDFNNRLVVKVTRIPVTGLNSIQYSRVVGFYSGQGNTALVPSHLLITSGADNDGDMITLEFYDIENSKEAEIKRQLFETKKKVVKDSFNIRQKFLPIDMSSLARWANIKLTEGTLAFNSFLTNIQILINNRAGKTGVGAYVKLAEVYYNLYKIAKVEQDRHKSDLTVLLDELSKLTDEKEIKAKNKQIEAKKLDIDNAGKFNKVIKFNGKTYDNILGSKIWSKTEEAGNEYQQLRIEGLVTTTTDIDVLTKGVFDTVKFDEFIEHINQYRELSKSEPISDDEKTQLLNHFTGVSKDKLQIKGVRYVGDKLYKEDYMMLSKVIEIVANAALDNSKEAYLGKLNIYPTTWALHEGMVLTSVDENDIYALMTHPALDYILKEIEGNTSIYSEDEGNTTLGAVLEYIMFNKDKLAFTKQSDKKMIENIAMESVRKAKVDAMKVSDKVIIKETYTTTEKEEAIKYETNKSKLELEKKKLYELRDVDTLLRKKIYPITLEIEKLTKSLEGYKLAKSNIEKTLKVNSTETLLIRQSENQTKINTVLAQIEVFNNNIKTIEELRIPTISNVNTQYLLIDTIKANIDLFEKEYLKVSDGEIEAQKKLDYGDDNTKIDDILKTKISIDNILEEFNGIYTLEPEEFVNQRLVGLGLDKNDLRFFKPVRMTITKSEKDNILFVLEKPEVDNFGNAYIETEEEWDERKKKLQYLYASIYQFETVGQEINNLRNIMSILEGIKSVDKENSKQIRMMIDSLGYTNMTKTNTTYEILTYIENTLLSFDKKEAETEAKKERSFNLISARRFVLENPYVVANIRALIYDFNKKQDMIITKNPVVASSIQSLKDDVYSGDKGKDDKIKKNLDKHISMYLLSSKFINDQKLNTSTIVGNKDSYWSSLDIQFGSKVGDFAPLSVFQDDILTMIKLDLSKLNDREKFMQLYYELIIKIKSIEPDGKLSKSVMFKRITNFFKNTVTDTSKEGNKKIDLIRVRDSELKNKLRNDFENMVTETNIERIIPPTATDSEIADLRNQILIDKSILPLAHFLSQATTIYSILKDNMSLSNGSFAEVIDLENNAKYAEFLHEQRTLYTNLKQNYDDVNKVARNKAYKDADDIAELAISEVNSKSNIVELREKLDKEIEKQKDVYKTKKDAKDAFTRLLENDFNGVGKLYDEILELVSTTIADEQVLINDIIAILDKKQQKNSKKAGKSSADFVIPVLQEINNRPNAEIKAGIAALKLKVSTQEAIDKKEIDKINNELNKEKQSILKFFNITTLKNQTEATFTGEMNEATKKVFEEFEKLSKMEEAIVQENPDFSYRYNPRIPHPTEEKKKVFAFGSTKSISKQSIAIFDNYKPSIPNNVDHIIDEYHPNVMNVETMTSNGYLSVKKAELFKKELPPFVHIKTWDITNKKWITSLYKLRDMRSKEDKENFDKVFYVKQYKSTSDLGNNYTADNNPSEVPVLNEKNVVDKNEVSLESYKQRVATYKSYYKGILDEKLSLPKRNNIIHNDAVTSGENTDNLKQEGLVEEKECIKS